LRYPYHVLAVAEKQKMQIQMADGNNDTAEDFN